MCKKFIIKNASLKIYIVILALFVFEISPALKKKREILDAWLDNNEKIASMEKRIAELEKILISAKDVKSIIELLTRIEKIELKYMSNLDQFPQEYGSKIANIRRSAHRNLEDIEASCCSVM